VEHSQTNETGADAPNCADAQDEEDRNEIH
jgi:hypothetical protein